MLSSATSVRAMVTSKPWQVCHFSTYTTITDDRRTENIGLLICTRLPTIDLDDIFVPTTVQDGRKKIAVVVYNHNTRKFENIVSAKAIRDTLIQSLRNSVDKMIFGALEDQSPGSKDCSQWITFDLCLWDWQTIQVWQRFSVAQSSAR